MESYEIICHERELPVSFKCYNVTNQIILGHWHHHVELIYILNGCMEVQVNNRQYILEEKGLFIVNSGIIHQTKVTSETSVLLLQIPYNLILQALPEFNAISFKEYFPIGKYKNNKCFLDITKDLVDMGNIFANKKPGYIFLFNSLLHQVLYDLYINFLDTSQKTKISKDNLLKLKKATDYINENYKNHISVNEMANYLALNPEYFCRFFKKNMGSTFLEYVNLVRLTYIYEDIINTTDSITQIQNNHGFTNYKVFSRMFKQEYGDTPSRIRNNK